MTTTDDLLDLADAINERLKSSAPSGDAMKAATDLIDDLMDVLRRAREARRDIQDSRGPAIIAAWKRLDDALAGPSRGPGRKDTDVSVDEMACGESYDHNLEVVDERDGWVTYMCSECGAEVIEDGDGNAV